MDDLLEANIRRAVEKELYSLRRYRVQLKNLQLDLIDHPQPNFNDGGKCNLPGDPVGMQVAREADIKDKISRLSTKIQRTENALTGLTKEERELVDLKYLSERHHSNEYIMDALCISKNQYYKQKDQILIVLANMLWPHELVK